MSRWLSTSDICQFAVLLMILGVMVTNVAQASDSDAGYPGAFLRHGGSVRSQALGEAGVVLEGGASGMFYNPANLMRTETALGVSFMHFSNPLVDGYNSVALSMNRMYKGDSGVLKYLFGPNSGWGVMFLDLGVDGIIQRSAENQLLDGELSYFDQAVIMGFAHETIGSQGVLDYGMNLKFVGQGFDGAGEYANSNWGFGLDVGVNYQPINPTLIKEIASLKFLLPLRLGLNIQNLISPEMGVLDSPDDGDDARQEKLPTMVRTGFAYNLYDLLGQDTRLLLVGDLDWMMETGENNGSRSMGTYLGCEGQIKAGPVALEPRLGFNSVAGESKLAAGFGVKYPLKSLMLQFDFSQGFNEYLDDERRVAFSIGLLGDRGAEYFQGKENASLGRSREYQILAQHSPDAQIGAAGELKDTLDVANASRYQRFIGGTSLARAEYGVMREKFHDGNFSEGEKKAGDVVSAYNKVIDGSLEDMKARDWIAQAEALLIRMEPGDDQLVAQVVEILDPNGAEWPDYNSERKYLLGVNALKTGNSTAAAFFAEASTATFRESRSMQLLSRYGQAVALRNSGNISGAKAILETLKIELVELDGHLPLSQDFSRAHPESEMGWDNPFSDADLADNVLFSLGLCHKDLGQLEEARYLFASVVRFYPDSNLTGMARAEVAR